ncbi:M16 family metallopeptidase [Candidatus Uabimicrobium sp. HlEnr_7]|uniref:M16 family metallopeptidase n=1 Tax=Candidatus Uabimicrobium helgolandensis TaxID=3095367 RepID=UPI003557390B
MTEYNNSYEILNIQETSLENGLKVLVLPRHYLPIVTVMLVYRVGGVNTWNGKTGIAHFLEHMMFKGTQKYPKGSIDLITQKLGGHNNAYTTCDYTCYYFMLAADRWQYALEIEADRMKNCLLSEKDFLSEKKVILEELTTSQDNPIEFLDQEVEVMSFHRHSYRNPILGWREDIENLTLKELREFYEHYYAPNNAVAIIVGDTTMKKVSRAVKQNFKDIPPITLKKENRIVEPPQKCQRRTQIISEVQLARFEIAFPTCRVGSKDDYTLDIIDTILTTGKTSRLYRRLVTEEQLLQMIISLNDSRKDPGLFRIVGEAHPGACEATIEKIMFSEIDKLKKRPVSSYELTKAKNIIIAEFIGQRETNYELAEKIAQFEMMSSYKEIDKLIEKVESVTTEDIHEICQKYLNVHQSTIGWSRPKKKKKFQGKKEKPLSLRGMRIPKTIGPIYQSKKPYKNTNILKRPIHEKRLENGLTILFMENHNLPNFSMSLHVKGGYLYEDPKKAGVAHLMGRLLSEGTRKYSMYKLACTCEFLGAGFKTSSTFLETRGFVRDFPKLCDITADIVQYPNLDADLLQTHKQKVITSLLSFQDNTSYQARKHFMKLIYANHPYARSPYGTLETINDITRNDITKMHKKYFVPNNTVIALVGNMDKDSVFGEIDSHLGKWAAHDITFNSLPVLKHKRKASTKLIPLDKKQVNVYWGHLGIKRSNPDYYTLLVLDHILGMGSGFTDRLSKKVRDDLGLVYNIWASITSSAAIQPGAFSAFFATDPRNYQKAIDVIKKEIKDMQKGKITKEEINNAKAYLTGSFIFSFETNSYLTDYLISAYRLQLGFDYVRRFKEKVEKVTQDDLVRVANEYLFPDKAITVVAGAVKK